MAEQVPVEQDVKSFGHMPRNGIAGTYGKFQPLWAFSTEILRVVAPVCSPTMNEGSLFPAFSPAFIVSCLCGSRLFLNLSHSDCYKIKSQNSL